MASRGEYNTRQKEKLLRFLRENPTRSFTIDEIVEDLKRQGDSVGKTTVYRHVEALDRMGCIRRSAPEGGGPAMYQFVPDAEACERHFHMQCVRCGELFHVDCRLFDELTEHMRDEHGFVIDARKSVLMGLCARCAAQERF